jgi:hypothetical protein
MTDADPRLAFLLSALGAHIGLPNLALSDDNICRIVLDGSLVIDIEHRLGSDNVQAFSVVGPHPGDNVQLLHKLLAGNLFGQGTGGAVLGLDEQRGEVLLCQPFDLSVITSERFISTMEAYVGYAQAWTSEILDSLEDEVIADDTHDVPSSGSAGFIRV